MIQKANIIGTTANGLPDLSATSVGSLFNATAGRTANIFLDNFKPAKIETKAASSISPMDVIGSAKKRMEDYFGEKREEDKQQRLWDREDEVWERESGLARQVAGLPSEQNIDTSEPKGASSNPDLNVKDLTGFIKGFEGFNQKSYWDYGQHSVGYGTKAKFAGETVTPQEAERRLASEVSMHRKRVERLNSKYKYNFNSNQLDALTSFDYNTGALEQLTANGKRTSGEIAFMIPAYNKAGGKVLRGLQRRRNSELDLFLKGYKR